MRLSEHILQGCKGTEKWKQDFASSNGGKYDTIATALLSKRKLPKDIRAFQLVLAIERTDLYACFPELLLLTEVPGLLGDDEDTLEEKIDKTNDETEMSREEIAELLKQAGY